MTMVIRTILLSVLILGGIILFVATLGSGYLTTDNWKSILVISLVGTACLLGFFLYCLFFYTVRGISNFANRKKGWIKRGIGSFFYAVCFLVTFLLFGIFGFLPSLRDLQQGPVHTSTYLLSLEIQQRSKGGASRYVRLCSHTPERLEVSYYVWMSFWEKLYSNNFYRPCTQAVDVLYFPHRKQIINITFSNK